MELGPWNWLEVAKIGAGVLTPAVIAAFGIYIHHVTKRFEYHQWQSQKLVEKRLAVYDDLAPLLNDLLCYFTYVGGWRDLNPPDIVSLKRVIDKNIHLAAPLFTTEFFVSCMTLQDLCFKPYGAWGHDASLRTHFKRRQEARAKDWNNDWNSYFSEDVSDPEAIQAAYKRVMGAFAQDIGVNTSVTVPPTGRVPANVR
jgi:hypothetical protein